MGGNFSEIPEDCQLPLSLVTGDPIEWRVHIEQQKEHKFTQIPNSPQPPLTHCLQPIKTVVLVSNIPR